MNYKDMMENLERAADQLKAIDDDLLLALAELAVRRRIQIAPVNDLISQKPVIMLPKKMWDRLWEIVPSQSTGRDQP
jgi:hypothetical protein